MIDGAARTAKWMRLRFLAATLPYALVSSGAVAAAVPVASPSLNAPSAVMTRVIAATAQAQRGLVGFETDSHLEAHAGFFRREQQERRWFVLSGGVALKTGLRPGSDAPFGKAAEEQKHEPWGAYGNEYHFSTATCDHCVAGTVAITFESDLHDRLHGHGTLLVDPDRARVVHETFIPYVLPGVARSALIDIEFGTTSVGWLPRSLHGDFSGRMGPFSGSAQLRETFEDYRRFASVDEAVTALGAPSTSPPSS